MVSFFSLIFSLGRLVAQLVQNPPAMRETWVRFLGWEGSPGEVKDYPLQYSDLGNSHGVTKSQTQLSDFYFRSVAQLCPTLCDPMNRSTPGLPVHHQLPEFIETHVNRVSDAIQPSHPLSSPSPLAPSPSQHESFPMSQLFA